MPKQLSRKKRLPNVLSLPRGRARRWGARTVMAISPFGSLEATTHGCVEAVERLRVRFAKLHTARMLEWDDLRYFLAFARAACRQQRRLWASTNRPCSVVLQSS